MANCLSSQLCQTVLSKGIKDSCDNPMFSGIKEGGVIINFNDIESVVRDANNRCIIRDIVLKAGAVAYPFINQRNNPFTGTNTAANVNELRNDFTRTVSGFVPMDGAETSKKILTPMANGRFVVILENDYVNDLGDNQYQVYGIDKGLRISTLQQTKYENNDYWIVELQEANVPDASVWFKKENCTEIVQTATTVTPDADGWFVDENSVSVPKTAEVTNLGACEINGTSYGQCYLVEWSAAGVEYHYNYTTAGATYPFQPGQSIEIQPTSTRCEDQTCEAIQAMLGDESEGE